MKKILKNLIPLALYWITFAVGFFIVLVFDLPSGVLVSRFACGNDYR